MKKSQELRKQAETLYRNIKDLYSKKELTDEDNQKFDQWNAEYDSLMERASKFEAFEMKEIEEAEETRQIEKTLKRGDESPELVKEKSNLALKEYILTGGVSPE